MNGAQLLIVLVGALAVTAYARRTGRQAPLLVVAVGFAASYLPGVPRFLIEPEIILAVVVPPLLYNTALTFSLQSFRRSLQAIVGLGVWLVLVLWAVMGPVSTALIPGLTGLAGFVLAAVIAPPDAVTAVSIGRRLGLPRRLMSVITGESLINDAMALTLFTLSLSRITNEHTITDNVATLFAYGTAVGIAVGLLIGFIVQQLRGRLNDAPIETVIGLTVPFAAYLGAETLEASGVVAVVTAGFYLGHRSTGTGFATRLQERTVFEAVNTLLEALVFAYMGLQLRFVVEDLQDAGLGVGGFFGAAGLVLLIAVAVRILFVYLIQAYRNGIDWLKARNPRPSRPRRERQGGPAWARDQRTEVNWRETTVVAWSGMRGVVTIAAAAAIPEGVEARVQIQAVAFVVAVGTLLLQGATLPWLIRRLQISDPAQVEEDMEQRRRAAQIGRAASATALTELAKKPDGPMSLPGMNGFLERMRLSGEAQQRVQNLTVGRDPGAPAVDAAELDLRTGPQQVPSGFGDADRRAQATTAGDPKAMARMFRAGADAFEQPSREAIQAIGRVRADMLQAQRVALVAERDAGRLDDEIMREVLEQLDLEQAAAEGRLD